CARGDFGTAMDYW
nr:immunoglobulin heavy chain junction region [Mus musculus]